MATDMEEKQEAFLIDADKTLQQKVGTGEVSPHLVEKCQDTIDKNTVDFIPLATEYLEKLTNAIKQAKAENISKTEAVQMLTEPVMQLKGNAATFKYALISNLANIMLNFLETVDVIDADVIEIVEVHHKTLSAIARNKMKGDGGASGKKLEKELQAACERYFSKKKS